MNIEPDRLREVFCYRDERLVSKQLAFSYERQRIILTENEITRGIAGKYVDTLAFPDGGFEVRWKGVPIPYSTKTSASHTQPSPRTNVSAPS